MPRGDGTGPAGWGPMTGRGAGWCAGHPVPGYRNPVPGYGLRGRGAWGSGRVWRTWFRPAGLFGWMRGGWGEWAPPNAPPVDTEEQFLQEQAEVLQSRLDEIRTRLGDISSAKGDRAAGSDLSEE